MISINNLTISFTGNELFSEISFIINDNDRIGLVGKNGSGKTTLLRLIKGMVEPDKGNVFIPGETNIGFLPQEMELNSKCSIFDEAIKAFSQVLELEEKIKRYNIEVAHRKDYESKQYYELLDKLHDANTMYHYHGGHSMIADTEKVLKGLGFKSEDLQRPISEFSSGWQMRVELAKILLQKPEVILLDEPTNHLDIESIQWLEDYLKNYNGAIVLVSHDRAFLDNITQRTIEISFGKVYDYKANYSEYVNLREERVEQEMASYNNQQKEIKDIEKFIDKFRYKATKAKQVQSRIKKLNKLDIIEIDERDKSSIHFQFPPAPHSGKLVTEARQVFGGRGESQGDRLLAPHQRARIQPQFRCHDHRRRVDSLADGVTTDLCRRPRVRIQMEHGVDARHPALHGERPDLSKYHHNELTFGLLTASRELHPAAVA